MTTAKTAKMTKTPAKKKTTTTTRKRMSTTTKKKETPLLNAIHVKREELAIDYNPRGEFPISQIEGVITVTTEGIKTFAPLTVLPPVEGVYPVVDGYTRLSAYDKGVEEGTLPEDKRQIPVVIEDIPHAEIPAYQIVLNSGNKLNTQETNDAIRASLERGLTVLDISNITGVSRQHIYNVGFLLRLSPEMQKIIEDGWIKANVAHALKKIYPDENQLELIEEILNAFNNDRGRSEEFPEKVLNLKDFWRWAESSKYDIPLPEGKTQKKAKESKVKPSLKKVLYTNLLGARPLEDGSYSVVLSKEDYELLLEQSYSKSAEPKVSATERAAIESFYLQFVSNKYRGNVAPLASGLFNLIAFEETAKEVVEKDPTLQLMTQKMGDTTFSYVIYPMPEETNDGEPSDSQLPDDSAGDASDSATPPTVEIPPLAPSDITAADIQKFF